MTHLLRQQPLLGLSQWGTGPNKQKQPLSLFWGGRDLLRSNNRLPGKLGKAASFGNSSGGRRRGERGAVFFLQRGTAQQILSLVFRMALGWEKHSSLLLALWLLQKKGEVSLCEIGFVRWKERAIVRSVHCGFFLSLSRGGEKEPPPLLFSPIFFAKFAAFADLGRSLQKRHLPPLPA